MNKPVQAVKRVLRRRRQPAEPPALLRERVTSKGGTTAAALAVLGAAHVNDSIVRAVAAAQARAQELAEEFGRG